MEAINPILVTMIIKLMNETRGAVKTFCHNELALYFNHYLFLVSLLYLTRSSGYVAMTDVVPANPPATSLLTGV